MKHHVYIHTHTYIHTYIHTNTHTHTYTLRISVVYGYRIEGLGIESRWGEIFNILLDRYCGPHSLLYNEYRVFPGGKAATAWRLQSTPSSAKVKESVDYTSTPSGVRDLF